jgi:hypothetical protein
LTYTSICKWYNYQRKVHSDTWIQISGENRHLNSLDVTRIMDRSQFYGRFCERKIIQRAKSNKPDGHLSEKNRLLNEMLCTSTSSVTQTYVCFPLLTTVQKFIFFAQMSIWFIRFRSLDYFSFAQRSICFFRFRSFGLFFFRSNVHFFSALSGCHFAQMSSASPQRM